MTEPLRTFRRDFLKVGLATAVGAGLASSAQAATSEAVPAAAGGRLSLREKFFGCICGAHIGSAMGAPCENWSYDRIQRTHGTIDKLMGYQHYNNGWNREPGTTEDGIERQKLMIYAIVEKQDRVTAADVRAAWVHHMNPNAANMISEGFEGALLAMAKSPMPAGDIGRYCDYSGLNSMGRACHPIGLINAGDIDGAIRDVRDVGQLYNTANSRGIRWAEVAAVGIAAATKPDATVDSVLDTMLANCDKADKAFEHGVGVVDELRRGLQLTEGAADFRELRKRFDSVYNGVGQPYAMSYANEVITKGVCIFKMAKGNTWDAIIAAVNFGRDTDCLAAVAAGLSGALTGADSIAKDVIAQVDRATSLNPHTCSKLTLRQYADSLYDAYKARLKKMHAQVDRMDAA
jgi:ADP-ribosylglycohydrolase